MTRLFVAVDLPDHVKDRLRGVCQGVHGARWVHDDQFHITLSFLGQVEGPEQRALQEGLAGVRCDPFVLRLSGIGHFPPRGRPTVLWAGIDPDDELRVLQRRVLSRLQRLGHPPETRRYAPHVTLARLVRPAMGPLLEFMAVHADFGTETFAVTDFQLYSSVLARSGAVHRIEASYPLMGR
jgi:2'-5' RNA ligase